MRKETKSLEFEKHLVAIECVVFAFVDFQVKTMLVKHDHEPWSVLGGVIHDSTVDDTARQLLNRLPGIQAAHLEQLRVYTDLNRYGESKVMTITCCVIAKFDQTSLPDGYHWFTLRQVPDFNDRFASMFSLAKNKLKEISDDFFVVASLLPAKFTIIQIQRIYESLSETLLDNRNFSRRLRSGNSLVRLDEKLIGISKKGSYYYRFHTRYLMSPDKPNIMRPDSGRDYEVHDVLMEGKAFS